MEGVPFANGAPNLTVDMPCMLQLAKERGVPICGKDFKTGQTWLKTVIAPGIKARMLGLAGWYSTNILGNRDGEVLDDPASFKTKERVEAQCAALHLAARVLPRRCTVTSHTSCGSTTTSRAATTKKGGTTSTLSGWMGYPMQIKINFLCRDSILAAPLVLDLALFSDFAQRAGLKGIQEWLSFYLQEPHGGKRIAPGA